MQETKGRQAKRFGRSLLASVSAIALTLAPVTVTGLPHFDLPHWGFTLPILLVQGAQAHQSAANKCVDRATGVTIPGAAFDNSGHAGPRSDYNKAITFQASDGFYANFHDPVANVDRPIEGSAYYKWPQTATPNQTLDPIAIQGSHAPQPINGNGGTVLVWDSDNVLRVMSGTTQEPAFAQPGYYNNGFAATSPDLLSCVGEDAYEQLNYVNSANTSDTGTSWLEECCFTLNDGDKPHNNGIYVSDSFNGLHRYASDKVQLVGDTRAGLDLPSAWAASEPTGNFGNFADANGNQNAMPGAPSAAINQPPTPDMLSTVAAEYTQGGFDLTKLTSRHVMVAERFHKSDLQLPGTGSNPTLETAGFQTTLIMVDQNFQPGYTMTWWNYNTYKYSGTENYLGEGGQNAAGIASERANDYPVQDQNNGAANGQIDYAIALSSWLPDTVSKIELECFSTQGGTSAGAKQLAPAVRLMEGWIADGTGTEFCDPNAMAGNPLVARAPHAFNGVYCASLGTATSPILAAGDPGSVTVDPATGTSGTGHAHMGPSFGFQRGPKATSGGADIMNGDSSVQNPF